MQFVIWLDYLLQMSCRIQAFILEPYTSLEMCKIAREIKVFLGLYFSVCLCPVY